MERRLRPLSIGEVLDAAVWLYRNNFAALMKAVALVTVAAGILGFAIESMIGLRDVPETAEELEGGDIVILLSGVLVSATLAGLAGLLATGAAFKILIAGYIGGAADWRESLRFARTRMWSLLWIGILSGLIVALGLLLLIIPGIYLAVGYAIAAPVLFVEGLHGRAALRRSRYLVYGRWWRTAVVLLLQSLIVAALTIPLSALLLAVISTDADSTAAAALTAVAEVIASTVVTPFSSAVVLVLYFDHRLRKEGIDLAEVSRVAGIELPAQGVALPPTYEPPRGGDGNQPPHWPPPPGWKPEP